MEKNSTTIDSNKVFDALSLVNRKHLKLEGIAEIVSSSDTTLIIKLKDTNLTITGQTMNIIKLDVNSGILEVEGIIDSIKYGKSVNFFKRIFK